MNDEKFHSLSAMLLVVGWGVSSITPAAAQTTAGAEETDRWSFDAVPYLWVPNLDVATSLPSTPPGVDRFDTSISAGAMLAAQARYGSVGLFVDFAWLRLDTEALNPGPGFSSVNLKSDLIHTTMALTYCMPPQGNLDAEVLVGARLWNVNEDLEFQSGEQPGFTSGSNKTWVDPVIGANLRYDLSRRWFVPVRGTVGGFGVSSDLVWEVFGGVGFRFSDWCSATVGYRYLHEDYSRNGFSFSMDAHGVLVGVGFHF